ncbi:MAG TPA: DUF333 domain-containing protein [bacterium]|nr:DUF333 domain-containing protein [bacterium]HPL95748.1 DUF333 domain-containing protein [bacterium]
MKKSILISLAIFILLVLIVGIIQLINTKDSRPNACTLEAKICPDGTSVGRSGPNCEFAVCPQENKNTETNLSDIFELNKKESGTKIYYSQNLGIGFTYLDHADRKPVVIIEKDNKISVDDQSIEVFEKDPVASLEQAIKDKFLKGYNPADCFVKMQEKSEQVLANYMVAVISYPPADNPDDPWWQNSEKCPKNYSATNGIQYFLMNREVPDRFLFVKVGQYSAASDGTPSTADSGFNWTNSIRVLPRENNNQNNTAPGVVGMANPASVNCVNKGGTLMMKENKLGQYGVCLFDDNRQCEEWALFRGECPVGGLKITGYENEAQAYCAITGGTVEGLGTTSVLCKRVDGTKCEVTANFNGECPEPHDPNPSAGNVEIE